MGPRKTPEHSVIPSVASTKSHLLNVSILREKIQQNLSKHVPDSCFALGTAVHENKLAQREAYLSDLSAKLDSLLPQSLSSMTTLRTLLSDLKRQSGSVKAALGMCKKRMELRSHRPPQELIVDSFDKILREEHGLLVAASKDLSAQMQTGRELLKPLVAANKKMQAARLTMRTDRNGCTEQLAGESAELLQSVGLFLTDSKVLLRDVKEAMSIAGESTSTVLKRHIEESFDVKTRLYLEAQQTQGTISEVETVLWKTRRKLKVAMSMPERSLDTGGDGQNSKLCEHTGVLSALRAKIKGAAYTGPCGRDMAELFKRFDRDKSGELDEEEVRGAIRKACKIPASVITDVDITALCELLDEDSSGAVGIAELVDFLLADIDVDGLHDEIGSLEEDLANLKAAQEATVNDLRAKAAVWRINDACFKITPVKGLGLDNDPALKPRKERSSRAQPPPRQTSKLRESLTNAIASGKRQANIESSMQVTRAQHQQQQQQEYSPDISRISESLSAPPSPLSRQAAQRHQSSATPPIAGIVPLVQDPQTGVVGQQNPIDLCSADLKWESLVRSDCPDGVHLRGAAKPLQDDPALLLIFEGLAWPPPQRFAEAVLGSLARIGAVRPADLSVQLRDGNEHGLVVALSGSNQSIEQLRRLPLMDLMPMQYLVSTVLWNPSLQESRTQWVEDIHCAVIEEELECLRQDLIASGESEDFIARQLDHFGRELRAALNA